MKSSFLLSLLSVLSLSAQTKFIALNGEIEKGNFSKAESMIDSIIYLTKDLTPAMKYDLLFEKEKMERIKLDFTENRQDILPRIKKYIPGIDDQTILKWEADKSLETRIIDGEKKYFKGAVQNLFRINKQAKSEKEKLDGISREAKDIFLDSHIPEIVKNSLTSGQVVTSPVRMRIKYSVSVEANSVPEGEIIRCWLPYPRDGHARQSEIKLISVNSPDYSIADNKYLQRTLYVEQKSQKDKPALFEMQLEYTCSSEWYNIDPVKIKNYVTNSEEYKINTAERPPHIVFNEELKELSKKIIGNETNPYLKAKLIYEWIDANIPWAGALEYSTIENIPAYCIENKHGDCGIQTFLFMTLARYNGIPTKWQSGWMMHPGEKNLHDWCETYYEGYGWVPVDQSFKLQKSDDPKIKYYFTNGIDSYRLIVNDDFSRDLFPAKIYPRSETVDFQRGEVEWKGGNLYFNHWDYDMQIEYLSGSAQGK